MARETYMGNKAKALLLAVFFVLLCFSCKEPRREIVTPYSNLPFPNYVSDEEASAFIKDDFTILPNFFSHLPLVIFDVPEGKVPPNHRWDYEKGYPVPIPGAEPYIRGEIIVIDNKEGENRLKDKPAFVSPMQIHSTGVTRDFNEKGQYRIDLLSRRGIRENFPLLGMESGDEWELLATTKDKSLIRDFLLLTMASKIMRFTPEARYCEVLLKDGEDYHYQGVFLLVQPVRQSLKFLTASGFILRRDSYNPEEIMLETYASRINSSSGYLDLVYPNENITGRLLSGIEESISQMERILYSTTPVVYVNYPEYLDMDSFIDYCLLNEYFMNIDAGFHSTYLYKEAKGKITAGPVWDNSGSFDNRGFEDDLKKVSFFEAPWFDQVTRDLTFLRKLENRFSNLRRVLLSDDAVLRLVDETARYLGSAQQRDWKRWAHVYTGTYENELTKIKYMLVEHSKVIGDQIQRMTWNRELMDSSYSNLRSTFLVVGFIVLYFLSVWIARRR